MRKGARKRNQKVTVKLNDQIRYPEVRVLDDAGKNLGTMSSKEALGAAIKIGMDLVEISSRSRPVLVKITDYGRFSYEQKKKLKETKSKQKNTEIKNIQVKVGTGEGDLILKAKNISLWLGDGHRVKLDLFLRGRAKYLEKGFLEERLTRILKLVTVAHKISDGPKKSHKGLSLTLEKGTKKDMEVLQNSTNKKENDKNK